MRTYAKKNRKNYLKFHNQLIKLVTLRSTHNLIFFSLNLKKKIFFLSVTSIYQKDDPGIPENYTFLSITTALSEVLEKLLYKQVNAYFLSEKLLSNTQFGLEHAK